MKYIFSFLITILMFNCSKYNETLSEGLSSFKEIKVSDFNTDFPIINFTVDQEEFDYMYLNYKENIEIEGFLNLYRNNELLISDELVELEIKGGKSASFKLKSLGVKFDEAFDNKDKELLSPEKILGHHSLDEIKAFRLRNSGNDFIGTLIKDISYTQLAINANLDVDLTYYEPAIVFVNDFFLGVMNLRSEANTNGVSRLNNVKKKEITLAKISGPKDLDKKDGDFDRIDNLIEAIEEKDLTFLKEDIDISNFIDYMIFQSYIGNVDWPHNNVRFYAVNEEPFRFVIYDLDWANTKEIENHPLIFISDPRTVALGLFIRDNPITNLFNVLYSDASFKTQFDKRYNELLENESFSKEKFNTIIDTNFNNIEEYMPYQVDKYTGIGTMIEWYQNIGLLKVNFNEREREIESMRPLF